MTSDTAAIPARNNKPKILFVDDEPLVLEGLRRSLYREFNSDLAEGPGAGLEKVKKEGPYIVVVSDMRMPVMDGAEFLSRVHTLAPTQSASCSPDIPTWKPPCAPSMKAESSVSSTSRSPQKT